MSIANSNKNLRFYFFLINALEFFSDPHNLYNKLKIDFIPFNLFLKVKKKLRDQKKWWVLASKKFETTSFLPVIDQFVVSLTDRISAYQQIDHFAFLNN